MCMYKTNLSCLNEIFMVILLHKRKTLQHAPQQHAACETKPWILENPWAVAVEFWQHIISKLLYQFCTNGFRLIGASVADASPCGVICSTHSDTTASTSNITAYLGALHATKRNH